MQKSAFWKSKAQNWKKDKSDKEKKMYYKNVSSIL